MTIIRGCSVTLAILILWQMVVLIFKFPAYILPGPIEVFHTWISQANIIAAEAVPTIIEALVGFVLGSLLGASCALLMIVFRPMGLWLMPLLIISQAIPTFAIAPLLVVWFGYGMASKIITTMIMLFFPVASAFYDGLKRTDKAWLDLAKTMQATTWRRLWHIQLPAALPSLGSGLRMAAVFAPIGAVVGEWVGASQGLGFLMLNSDARMQIPMMFAALLTIVLFSLLLYFTVDQILKRVIQW